jgi:hypothetical protein
MGTASLPMLVWSAHFFAIYGFTALACAREMSGLVPWVVGVASVGALAVLIAVGVAAGVRVARAARLEDSLALGLAGLAIVAVVWESSSLPWIAACA